MTSTTKTDGAAIALSTACILHCVALPAVAVGLPLAATIAGNESIHWILTGLALSASIYVFTTSRSARRASFTIPAGLGATLLVSAIFAESVGANEQLPTVIGGLLLAGAHLWRFREHRSH